MINEQLMQEAVKLASRPYATSLEVDTLSSGERIYLLRNPELPAVKAQGLDLQEANRNLDEARTDYIYSLLEDGLPVPAPAASSSTASSSVNGRVWNISGSAHDEDEESTPGTVVVPGGDLVKHS